MAVEPCQGFVRHEINQANGTRLDNFVDRVTLSAVNTLIAFHIVHEHQCFVCLCFERLQYLLTFKPVSRSLSLPAQLQACVKLALKEHCDDCFEHEVVEEQGKAWGQVFLHLVNEFLAQFILEARFCFLILQQSFGVKFEQKYKHDIAGHDVQIPSKGLAKSSQLIAMNDFEEDEQVPYTHEDKVGM